MSYEIVHGQITQMKVDAIVNAANNQLQAGGGVCGAIFHAAGATQLQKECDQIGYCETGQAVITKAYNLPAKFIIHTVGPVWQGGTHHEPELLRDCYINSLKLAKEHHIKTIAFPIISGGIYGFPKDHALQIAVSSISQCELSANMQVSIMIFNSATAIITRLPDNNLI